VRLDHLLSKELCSSSEGELEALVDLPQVGSNDINMRAHLGCDMRRGGRLSRPAVRLKGMFDRFAVVTADENFSNGGSELDREGL
jgi:hypothetical protein